MKTGISEPGRESLENQQGQQAALADKTFQEVERERVKDGILCPYVI